MSDFCFTENTQAEPQGDLLDKDFTPEYVPKSSRIDALVLEQESEVTVVKNSDPIIYGWVQVLASENTQIREKRKYSIRENIQDMLSEVITNFRGNFVTVQGQELIQLMNEDNGKVTYMKPPEKDANNNKIDSTKIYKVALQKHKLSGATTYILTPIEPKKYTKQEIENVLQELAESL